MHFPCKCFPSFLFYHRENGHLLQVCNFAAVNIGCNLGHDLILGRLFGMQKILTDIITTNGITVLNAAKSNENFTGKYFTNHYSEKRKKRTCKFEPVCRSFFFRFLEHRQLMSLQVCIIDYEQCFSLICLYGDILFL